MDTDLTVERIEGVINLPREQWAGSCHSVSLAVVKAGLIDGGRVARGFCSGVLSQHSWIVAGDPYAPDAWIVDPTLWTYRDDVHDVWVGSASQGLHVPHGAGSIWEWGRPTTQGGAPIVLNRDGLSQIAVAFLDLIEPLDRKGWMMLLSSAPVGGWPAAEIVARAAADDRLRTLIPVDRVGMLTDLNPYGLYF